MSEPIRKSILASLQSMLSHPEEKTRSAAAGCLGALFRQLPADELVTLFNNYLIQDDPSLDWTLCHGKSACLSVTSRKRPRKSTRRNGAISCTVSSSVTWRTTGSHPVQQHPGHRLPLKSPDDERLH
jgi:hypothetical protein